MKKISAIFLATAMSALGIYLLSEKNYTTNNILESSRPDDRLNSAQESQRPQDITKEYTKNSTTSDIHNFDKSTNIEDYIEADNLHEKVDHYFNSLNNLNDNEKLELSNEILVGVVNLERKNEIIPIEALSLKLALLKTTTEDAAYPELAKKLTEEYQDKISSEEPEIDFNKNAIYKQREREVLLEVQAISQYPDGMSKSEYLRHRLQLLRTEVFEEND